MSEAIEEGFNEIYFRIPRRELDEGYMDMVEFTETVAAGKLRSILMHTLSSEKRIFRRFKDVPASDGQVTIVWFYLFETGLH